MLVGMQVGTATLETVWRSLKKSKIELPYDPAIALLGIYPKDTEVVKRRAICTPMFIAALSTIAKLWKETRCPSTDDWIKKIWSIYTMDYYSAIKKNNFSTFAATWTAPEEIMLSEISQAGKDNYHMISLIYGTQELGRSVGVERDKERGCNQKGE